MLQCSVLCNTVYAVLYYCVCVCVYKIIRESFSPCPRVTLICSVMFIRHNWQRGGIIMASYRKIEEFSANKENIELPGACGNF